MALSIIQSAADSSSSGGFTVTLPGSSANGNFLIAIWTTVSGASGAPTLGGSWTDIIDQEMTAQSGSWVYAAWMPIAGGENSVTFGDVHSGSGIAIQGALLEVEADGGGGISIGDVQYNDQSGTGTTIPMPTTAGLTGDLLIAVGQMHDDDFESCSWSDSFTEEIYDEINTTIDGTIVVGYRVVPSDTDYDTTASLVTGSNDQRHGFMFAVHEEPGVVFDDIRQDIIDGLDGDLATGTSWDAVISSLPVTAVVRTSDTVVTITLTSDLSSYDITEQETITVTVPASALAGGSPIVADPPFTVDADVGYSIVAETADFSYAGQSVTAKADRLLSAATADHSYAGQPAGLFAGRRLSADTAGHDYAGQSVGILADRILSADTANHDYAGQAVSFFKGRTLSAEAGNFDYAGQSVGLFAARVLSADTGGYTLAGQSVTLVYTPLGAYVLTADGAVFNLAGQAVGLTADRLLSIATGGFTVAGSDVGLFRGFALSAETAGFDYEGQSVSLLADRLLSATTGGFEYAGQAVGLIYTPAGAYLLIADGGGFSLAGQAVGLLKTSRLAISSGAFDWAGQGVGLYRGYPLVIGSGGFTFSGQGIDFSRTYLIPAENGNFVLAGQSVYLDYSAVIIPEASQDYKALLRLRGFEAIERRRDYSAGQRKRNYTAH